MLQEVLPIRRLGPEERPIRYQLQVQVVEPELLEKIRPSLHHLRPIHLPELRPEPLVTELLKEAPPIHR